MALLGGSGNNDLPSGWTRILRIVAGLRQVNLDIRVGADASRRAVIQQLRSSPPDGLLIWASWVKDPDAFITPYLQARPKAYAQVLGTQQGVMSFSDCASELALHLQVLAPLDEELPALETGPISWDEAALEIEALVGVHFVLTHRATQMLHRNAYPFPRRMIDQASRLSRIARQFHARGGVLGQRLEDFAMEEEGLLVSLFDADLDPPVIVIDGVELQARPHVKVDDYKSPSECGRIYFAIDHEHLRFVVDHIGLHNYG